MSLELRTNPTIELTARSKEGAEYLDGYAATFNEPTIIFDFEEVIAPGAFARALKENQDVRALFNHDSNFPLARTKNGTLVLREDAKGLWTESRLSKNATSDSIADYVRTGLVSGMSFAFTVRKNEWKFEEPGSDKLDRRIITEIGILYDVGPVTYPAYEATSVKIRSEAKKLHDEARTRWEQRKITKQVPVGFGEIHKECRSAGDIWEVEADDVIVPVEAPVSKSEVRGDEEAKPNDEIKKEEAQPMQAVPASEGVTQAPAPSEAPAHPADEVGKDAGVQDSVVIEENAASIEALKRKIGIQRLRLGLR